MTIVILCNTILSALVLTTIVGGLIATILTQEPRHTHTRESTVHKRVATPVLVTPETTRA